MIDTSTTAGKILVMQAYEDGKSVELGSMNIDWSYLPPSNECEPLWDWEGFNYRVKPQTVEEAAEEDFNISEWLTTNAKSIYLSGARFGYEFRKGKDNE